MQPANPPPERVSSPVIALPTLALSEHGARIFGVLAIAVGLVLVWFYFYLRRAIARDEETLQKPLATRSLTNSI
jgi:hypothetical protein